MTDGTVKILAEDAAVVVADKPPGVLSVPGKGPDLADCVLSRLEAGMDEVYLVHRLDRDTSGVMIFAKTKEIQRHLGLQFERRHVAKRYVALVRGAPLADGGVIDMPLAADWPNRPRQMVTPDGRRAVTDWDVLDRGPVQSRLALRPMTGRSHQLRVHLMALGHPVVGDPLYGGGEAGRMMLHSESLMIRHPDDGRRVTYRAEVPF